MDKQSAESNKKKVKSGEGASSFDETADEELKELAKSVDVKTRIQVTLEDQEKSKEKQNDHLEDEELKEINLKGRLEMFNKLESEKHATENKVYNLTLYNNCGFYRPDASCCVKSVDFIKLHQVCEHQTFCNLDIDETTCIKPACS